MLTLEVAVPKGQVVRDIEGDQCAVRCQLFHGADAKCVEHRPLARPHGLTRLVLVRDATPGPILAGGQRAPEPRRDSGIAIEVGLFVAAPRSDVAIERNARVEMMHQVVVLVDEERCEDRFTTDPDAGRLVLVLPLSRSQPVVRKVVEPPGKDHQSKSLWDQVSPEQFRAVPGGRHAAERAQDGTCEHQGEGDFCTGTITQTT